MRYRLLQLSDPHLTAFFSLCSGVRTGVDEHVKDFRGQLTTEVSVFVARAGECVAEKILLVLRRYSACSKRLVCSSAYTLTEADATGLLTGGQIAG